MQGACNLDAPGVRRRRLGGGLAALAAAGVACAQIAAGHAPLARVPAAFLLTGFAALGLLQARART